MTERHVTTQHDGRRTQHDIDTHNTTENTVLSPVKSPADEGRQILLNVATDL